MVAKSARFVLPGLFEVGFGLQMCALLANVAAEDAPALWRCVRVRVLPLGLV